MLAELGDMDSEARQYKNNHIFKKWIPLNLKTLL